MALSEFLVHTSLPRFIDEETIHTNNFIFDWREISWKDPV